jgi:type VI protein secretion system component Hcp
MAEQNKTDLVMQFVLKGNPVWAECALDVWKGDTLMKDFKPADYDNYSSFFEIKDFDIKLALKDRDEPDSPSAVAKSGATGPYPRWRSASDREYKNIPYPLEVDAFSFTRVIDSASPIFFENCCRSITFDSAVLVKRLSQGSGSGDAQLPSAGYMRIDFKEVLITSIGWDDGDMVEEKCACLCRGMTITYRKQNDDGTIGAAGETRAVWPNPKHDRTLNIRGLRRGS